MRRLNTLAVQLPLTVLAMLVPFLAYLLVFTFYATTVVRDQVAFSFAQVSKVSVRRMDDVMANAGNVLTQFVADRDDLVLLGAAQPGDELEFAKIRLSRDLTSTLASLPDVGDLFILGPTGTPFIACHSGGTYLLRQAMKDVVVQRVRQGAPTATWALVQAGDRRCLVWMIETNGVFVGTWVDTDSLLNTVQGGAAVGPGLTVVASADGTVFSSPAWVREHHIRLGPQAGGYSRSGESGGYLLVGAPSGMGPVQLVEILPEASIQERIPLFQRLSVVIALLALVVVPGLLLFLRRTVHRPLNRVLAAITDIQDGDIQARIPTDGVSNEFQAVFERFNSMVERIQTLKIQVYEEDLLVQKAELEHLQAQVNPHFYLNTLNMVYSLAQVGETALIQELTLCLVRYFRYMMGTNRKMTTLGDELDHVRNYLRIQELRLPGFLDSSVVAEPALRSVPIPPLVVQAFAENTVKYAISMDEKVSLTIEASLRSTSEGPELVIRIADTGPGYPDAVLAAMAAGDPLTTDQGERVGLWSVKRRLELTYGPRATLTLSNVPPHGAAAELILPLPEEVFP